MIPVNFIDLRIIPGIDQAAHVKHHIYVRIAET